MLVYEVDRHGAALINPVLVIRQGETFAADVTNHLDEATNIHWHGLSVDWQMDGHPLQAIALGATSSYLFPVLNRSVTYWYHPHTHLRTAWQVYHGLAGFFLVEDDEERQLRHALDLTLGETDIPLLLQDRIFDADGALVYPLDPMAQAMGVAGDTVLVNLTMRPTLPVGARLYRFRLLNGSNAHLYRLGFARRGMDAHLPAQVIGTDAGLLDRPYLVTDFFLAPGERQRSCVWTR